MNYDKAEARSIYELDAPAPQTMTSAVLEFMLAMEQFPRAKNESVNADDFALIEKLVFSKETGEIEEMRLGYEKFKAFQSYEHLVEFVDGAIDSLYVILWMLLKMNVPVTKCFAEVQRSNMAKLNADGTVTKDENGKVQKPAGWTLPNLHKILLEHYDMAVWNELSNTRKER